MQSNTKGGAEQAANVNVVDQKLNEEVKARGDQQLQLQRLALQEEIAGLSREIEERRMEKNRLESEIEQLRLHLELSEARDSDFFPPSEAKPGSTRRSVDNDIDVGEAQVRAVDELETENVDEYEQEELEDVTAEAKDDEDEPVEQDIDDEKEEPEEDESQEVKEDAARSLQLVQLITDAVARGKAQFNRGDKAKCYQTYAKCTERCITELQALHDKQRRQLAPTLKRVLGESARLPPARGPQTLRKQLDVVRDNCEEWLNIREQQAVARLAERNARNEAKAAAAAIRKQQNLEKQQKTEQKREDKSHHKKKKFRETKAKADRVKISQLEAALAKAETQLANGGGGGGSNSTAGNGTAASDRRVADMEKKHKKVLEDNEKAAKKEVAALTQQLQAAQKASQELQEQTSALQKELGVA
ncbi:Kinesin-like protein, partial [Phytophthora palmivora]